jgi:hypothetical protein
LRIWKEQGNIWGITFRYSPTADNILLLQRFTAIARDELCLLLDYDSGALFEADDAIVAEHLRNSHAARFMSDPKGTIIQAAKKMSE